MCNSIINYVRISKQEIAPADHEVCNLLLLGVNAAMFDHNDHTFSTHSDSPLTLSIYTGYARPTCAGHDVVFSVPRLCAKTLCSECLWSESSISMSVIPQVLACTIMACYYYSGN